MITKEILKKLEKPITVVVSESQRAIHELETNILELLYKLRNKLYETSEDRLFLAGMCAGMERAYILLTGHMVEEKE